MIGRVCGVSIQPGATAFARTPSGPQAMARLLVNWATPPRLAAYAGAVPDPKNVIIDAVLTTAPEASASTMRCCYAAHDLHRVVVGDIEQTQLGADERLVFARVVDLRRRAAGGDHRRAAREKARRHRPADPAGSARDDDHPAVQVLHHYSVAGSDPLVVPAR